MPRKSLIFFLFLVIGTLVYANSWSNSFIGDDGVIIVHNPLIKTWQSAPQIFLNSYVGQEAYYRPLAVLSHWVEYPFFGLNPFGYHVVNTLLHVFNAFFVYLILNKLLGRWPVAVFTGILFLIHPIQTEEVTYISGRCGLLAAVFLLGGLLAYMGYREGRGRSLFGCSVACFILGLFSKESVMVLPLLLVFYDYLISGKVDRGMGVRILPFLIAAGGYLYVRDMLGIGLIHFETILPGLWVRLVTMGQALLMYWGLTILPLDLMSDRLTPLAQMHQVHAVLSCIFVILVVGILIRWSRGSRLIKFTVGWFFILFAPMLQIVPLKVQGYLFTPEHFMYLPSVSVFLLAAGGVARLLSAGIVSNGAVWIVVSTVLVSYAALTARRNVDWKDPIAFYSLSVAQSPNNARAHVHLGLALNAQKALLGAEQAFKKAIQLKPDYVLAHNNLGITYAGKGEYTKAVEAFKSAARIDPDASEPRENLVYLKQWLVHQEGRTP